MLGTLGAFRVILQTRFSLIDFKRLWRTTLKRAIRGYCGLQSIGAHKNVLFFIDLKCVPIFY